MTLRGLIEAVGNGTFLMDVLSPEHEITAYEAFSGSLDAAKRLHDALLPGVPTKIVDMSQEHMGAHGWYVFVNWPHTEWRPHYTAPGPFSYAGKSDSPARAWLLAILRALDADQREGGE